LIVYLIFVSVAGGGYKIARISFPLKLIVIVPIPLSPAASSPEYWLKQATKREKANKEQIISIIEYLTIFFFTKKLLLIENFTY